MVTDPDITDIWKTNPQFGKTILPYGTNLPENSKVWKPGISFVTVTYFQIDDPVHTFISTFYSIFDFRTLQFFNVTHITENRGIS